MQAWQWEGGLASGVDLWSGGVGDRDVGDGRGETRLCWRWQGWCLVLAAKSEVGEGGVNEGGFDPGKVLNGVEVSWLGFVGVWA